MHPERRTKRRYFYYQCYSRRVRAGCDQPFFPEERLEAEVVSLLRMMATPDGLAEAVDTAISRVVSQQRKTSRSTRRKVLDQQLKRLAELYEMGDYTRDVYEKKKAVASFSWCKWPTGAGSDRMMSRRLAA